MITMISLNTPATQRDSADDHWTTINSDMFNRNAKPDPINSIESVDRITSDGGCVRRGDVGECYEWENPT